MQIPNPLFDLAGITCGHFLIPFWTFFGATLIGKAVIKMHIQVSIYCAPSAFFRVLVENNAGVWKICCDNWKQCTSENWHLRAEKPNVLSVLCTITLCLFDYVLYDWLKFVTHLYSFPESVCHISVQWAPCRADSRLDRVRTLICWLYVKCLSCSTVRCHTLVHTCKLHSVTIWRLRSWNCTENKALLMKWWVSLCIIASRWHCSFYVRQCCSI